MNYKLIAVWIVAAALLCACTDVPPPVVENRYLSLEEDQFLREKCEPFDAVGGCVAIPAPVWIQILRALKNPGQNT